MTPIPKQVRKEIDADPFYKLCCLYGQKGHICAGRITFDHAVVFARKQVQKVWAIIPVCAYGHGVDQFQDQAGSTKEIRLWVALNRATDAELKEISKVPPGYIHERDRLNKIYGVYAPIVPDPLDPPKDLKLSGGKTNWYPISDKDELHIAKIRAFNKHMGVSLSPFQTIAAAIENDYLQTRDSLLAYDKELYKKLGFDK